jgi:Mrp family chromosome partitioning ATPase
MNSENSTSSNSLSSQTGRKWLQQADILVPVDADDSQIAEKTIIVSIPDVGTSSDLLADGSVFVDSEATSPKEIEQVLSEATENRLNEISQAFAFQSDPAKSDLSEKPTEWTDKPETKESNRSGSKQSNSSNEAIEPLVDAILERFPLAESTVLLFVGSEANSHIDETCARISHLLADRNIGRVLLIDSDITGHELSRASGLEGEPGISDVVNQGVAWKPLIIGKSSAGLDFFPAGSGRFCHAEGQARLRLAIAQMKREYQFICVSAGDAHRPSAKIWTDICDGSYLLVSMKNSNETFAKSAVTELQSSGARLLGCVVTDVA